MLNKIIIFFATFSIYGCAVTESTNTQSKNAKNILEKNYIIGQEKYIYVGQPLIKVKDYWVTINKSLLAYPSNNYKIKSPFFIDLVNGNFGNPIPVTGKINKNGIYYSLIKPNGSGGVEFLIDEKGIFEGSGRNFLGPMLYTYKLEPYTTTFSLSENEAVDSTQGFINYEIIYSGATKDAIKLFYREYTQQDMARPAYSQELTYSKEFPKIRYKNLQIKIISADNESIKYIVIED